MDIFESIRKNDERFPQLLEKCKDINIKDEDGQSLIHVAAANGNLHAARQLSSAGIDVNSVDSDGNTPLHYAAEYQNVSMADILLNAGGKLSIKDKHGNTPVWTAVFNARGNYSLVELFMRFDGFHYVDLKNMYGKSPVDFARQIGDTRMIQILTGSEEDALLGE